MNKNKIFYISILVIVSVGTYFLGSYHNPPTAFPKHDQANVNKTNLASTTSIHVPEITSYVNDNSRVLDVDTETLLVKKLIAFSESGKDEIAVLTVKTLSGIPVEEFALNVLENWQNGDNNGILLLIATDERKVRIEVGSNVAITDAQSGQILDDVMVPRLKRDDYAGAINYGVDAVIKLISK